MSFECAMDCDAKEVVEGLREVAHEDRSEVAFEWPVCVYTVARLNKDHGTWVWVSGGYWLDINRIVITE